VCMCMRDCISCAKTACFQLFRLSFFFLSAHVVACESQGIPS